jgi:3-phenylpropionate/trans-cinnamate dioxygenase ferredoxin reductase subunit
MGASRLSSEDTVVVVGGGQAGGWAVKTLRDQHFAGRVVLIAQELHPPHERPPLSKSVLKGEAASETTHVFRSGLLESLGVEVRSGVEVLAIDRSARRLTLSEGEALPYSRLILCSGGRARPLQLPGGHLPQVHTLRSIEDAHRIREMLGEARKLAVIGAGWLGLEAAASARAKGLDVTVLESAPRVCQRSLPEPIAHFLKELHEAHGVRLRLGVEIRALHQCRTKPGIGIELASGEVLEADAAIAAVGLLANDELATRAGLATDQGILVDAACRTSDPDVFAAGDVAVAHNRWLGRRVRLESWQNAQDQGSAAARAALGEEVLYDPLPRFWSEQYDCHLQILGFPEVAEREVIRGDVKSHRFVAYYGKGERLVAAIAVNSPKELRNAQRLIEHEIHLDATLEPVQAARTAAPSTQR